MSPTNFNTENRTYRQLLGNGLTYRIPRFQRDYSWGEEEWEDLWADILGALPDDGEQAHYMGYLVLQTANQRQFSVIDGQQRLTTVSLIVLAAMRILDRLSQVPASDGANQQRLQQLRATYIGYLDPVTLTTQNKLSLNRNNDSYYRDYLVPLAEHLPQRGFPASTHAMRKAFEWFEARLKQRIRGEADPGMALAQLVETLSDKLFFTVITVADELNAYKVFETLNARGVRLSATDLLLFSVLARDAHSHTTTDELERRWESIIGRLGSESFPDCLRMHWNSRNTFARQTDLFKAVRQRITSSGEVFALLRAIDEDIDTYLALIQPDGAQWPASCLRSAQELRMFSVRQPYPMLLAAHRALSQAEFEGLLRATVVIAFRYNVIGAQRTGDQERLYHQIALQLHRGELNGLAAVLQALKPIYRSDEAFKADFRDKTIKTSQSRNAKVVRYILSALEKEAGGADLDTVATGLSIEHLFPRPLMQAGRLSANAIKTPSCIVLATSPCLKRRSTVISPTLPTPISASPWLPAPSPQPARWPKPTTSGPLKRLPPVRPRWRGEPPRFGGSRSCLKVNRRAAPMGRDWLHGWPQARTDAGSYGSARA